MRVANQEEITIFTLMGQALLNIQVLEECLSVSITLRTSAEGPQNLSKEKATEMLKKHRSLTLGKAISKAQKNSLYSDSIQIALTSFLIERNWLVHKSIDDIYARTDKTALAHKINRLALEAHRIQRAIEDDLIEFSESQGVDMSSVRAAIKRGAFFN